MTADEGETERHTDVARQLAAGVVALVAGSMLAAWVTGLEIATRTDNFAPMSPLACVGFLSAAAGVWLLPRAPRRSAACGALAAACGLTGLLDVLLSNGEAINQGIFGADIRISVFTAAGLVLLGAAVALDGRQWAITRRL